ncbi:rod-binding protein [Thermosipho ferrireducens]|uniref:Rod-binding protein n=1 Tax=Thermosipho ferrireducens TaxID=2571116 RepID=A0ABX7SA46_9BACT|nr:rod-binding protein [Thermosipho ferrireducens]QTA38281.1 rod-binding protein [Thermosipho ferrireducens]
MKVFNNFNFKNAPISQNSNDKLKKVSEEFVAQFFFQVFRKMYDTIPKSRLIPESFGEKWFRENLLYEYSKKAAGSDLKILTDEVYKSLGGKMYSKNTVLRNVGKYKVESK